MRLIILYVLKNIKFNKSKSIGAALICFVCAAFFTAETLLLLNFKIRNTHELDNTFGIHNGIFACSSEMLSEIKSAPDFNETGTVSVLFHAIRDENFSERKIVVGAADENAIEFQKIHLVDGVFPQNSSEIALEQTTVELLFPNAEIGSKIMMKITAPDTCAAEFTLVGILANFSNLQWNPEEKNMPMINALTTADATQAVLYNFVSVIGEASDPEKLGYIYYPNQRDNYDTLNMISGISSDTTAVFIITLLACFTLSVMVFAAYALSRGVGKTIGLLKTSGFSGKTILGFFILRSTVIFVPTSILGAVVGAMISIYVDKELPDGGFTLSAFCSVIIVTVLTSANLLFMHEECKKTVIENLRLNAPNNLFTKTTFTSEKPAVLYSVKNFIINGKETAASCVMVFLSMLLFSASLPMISSLGHSLRLNAHVYDLTLGFLDETITSVYISRYGEAGIFDNDFEALRTHKNTGGILGCKRLYVYEIDQNKPFEPKGDGNLDDFQSIGFPICNLTANRLFGIDEMSLLRLEDFLTAGEIDMDVLRSGKNVVWKKGSDGLEHSVGDTLRLAYVTNRNPENPRMEDLEYFEKEVIISAIVDFPNNSSDDYGRLFNSCIKGNLIWSEKAFEQINTQKSYDVVYMNSVNKGEGFGSLYMVINDLKMKYGSRLFIADYLQEQQSDKQFYDMFRSISMMISGGLAVFSIFSLAIVTSTKISRRRQIFGFLRAIGMTKQQMFKMILLEIGLSTAVSFTSGIVCGATVSLIMGNPLFGFGVFALLAVVYAVAVFLIALIAVCWNFKFVIVESIRCE